MILFTIIKRARFSIVPQINAKLVLNLVWIAHVTLCVRTCLYRGGRPTGAGHTSEIYQKVHVLVQIYFTSTLDPADCFSYGITYFYLF